VYYWEAAPQQAVRHGNWKAYRKAPDQPLQVYDLANDVGETNDVAASQPEVAARLEKLLSESRVDSPEFPLTPQPKKKVKKP
jgi:arylsulfatase A-like enzyme